MKRIIPAFLLTLCLFLPLSAGQIELEAGVPIFVRPNFQSQVLAETAQKGMIPTISDQPVRGFTARHPLARYNNYYQVKLPDGRTGFATNEVRVERDGNGQPKLAQYFQIESWRTVLQLIFIAAFACSAILLWKCRKEDGTPRQAVLMIAAAVTMRQIMVLYATGLWGNMITSASDDPGYFETAIGFLKGDLKGPWNFTVGLGFIYMPFIKLLNAKVFYDITYVFSYFSGLVLAPSLLALGFLIAKRLKCSAWSAFAAAVLWALMPFFYFHFENWNKDLFPSLFSLPATEPNWWKYYATLINAGINSMSDVSSSVCLFGCILLTLGMPPQKRYVGILGLLFGFACLIRINNILFAPLLAYLAFHKFQEELTVKTGIAVLLTAAISFLAVFSLQLYVNYRHFGGIFQFPYVLHYQETAGPRPANGFTWGVFKTLRHVKLLAEGNYAIWVLGLTGMLLTRDRFRRNALVLWTVPVIWFFFGYSHTFCDARRFILSTYLPMFLAFTSQELFQTLPHKDTVLLAAVTGLTLIFCTPAPQLYSLSALPFPAAPFLSGAAMLTMAVWFFRQKKYGAVWYCAVFSILFFAGNAVFFAGILALILLRAVKDVIAEIAAHIQRTSSLRS